MLQRFFKNSIIYSIPVILSRGIGFILLPIFTRYLTPFEYGIIEFLTLAFAILNLILPLEISQAQARLMPDAENEEKSIYASTAFWFTAGMFSLFCVIVLLFPETMSLIILGDSNMTDIVIYGSLAMLSTASHYSIQNHLRWCNHARQSAIISIMFTLIMSGVAVGLIVLFKFGILGYIYGQIVGSLLALMFGIYLTKSTIQIKLEFAYIKLKEMLSFSFPLLFSSIAVYFSLYADRWVIREFLGINEVGIYSVGYRIASITLLGIMAFRMALTPLIYEHYKDPKTSIIIGNIFSYYLIFPLALIAFLGTFSKEIITLLTTPEYHEASKLVSWLSLAVMMMSIYIFSPGLGIAKKTKVIAIINIITAIINVLLNIILVKKYGMIGAVIATLISGFVMAGLYFWLGNKEYRINYRIWRCSFALLLTIAYLLINSLYTISLELRILSLCCYAFTILFTLINLSDWNILLKVIKNRIVYAKM